MQERDKEQNGGLAEKSRDVGFTWLCAAYAIHAFIFLEGQITGFGSRKLEYVDLRDDPKCIFEKLRYILRCTEKWMMPPGFSFSKHDKYCNLINPYNGNTISGEGGEELGRGGRSSRYFVDEAAFLPNPVSVDKALSNTTNVRIDISTPNGAGNPFHTKRFSGKVAVFTFKWTDDPRKDQAYYDEFKRINGDLITAQELDIDYSASIEGIVIPAKYVMAAIDYKSPTGIPLAANGIRVAGWDVAGEGDNSNVIIDRVGPVVQHVEMWGNLDTSQSTYKAIEICEKLDIRTLNYDVVGLGAGPKGVFNGLEKRPNFNISPINAGDTPTNCIWPDGKTSKEKFGNLRAELWCKLRERFRKTWERVMFEMNEAEGKYWPDSECISIPNHPELIAQLSMPIWAVRETGKYYLESKKDMRKRGIKSPDCADALALSEASASGSWTQLVQDLETINQTVARVQETINRDYPVALDLPMPIRSQYNNW